MARLNCFIFLRFSNSNQQLKGNYRLGTTPNPLSASGQNKAGSRDTTQDHLELSLTISLQPQNLAETTKLWDIFCWFCNKDKKKHSTCLKKWVTVHWSPANTKQIYPFAFSKKKLGKKNHHVPATEWTVDMRDHRGKENFQSPIWMKNALTELKHE